VSTFPLDQSFPLNILDEYKFENLSAHLLEQLYPAATVHRYGDKGDNQEGIDIYVKFSNGDIYTYQYKRVNSLGPDKVAKAVATHTFESKKNLSFFLELQPHKLGMRY